jgi:RimJ/RimL family protein N-acetyltransferase
MRTLGGFLPPLFYNFAFSQEGLQLRKLNFEAFVWHEAVVNLHLAHGARVIGVLQDHVFKHGKYHDVALFELTATAWNKQTRWQESKAEFEA